MRVVRSLPHPVREIEHCWIPMSDGIRLAARIWLPEGAEANPVPAIVEYIPYRKRDRTRWRDEPMHHYFAGHGYAAVRVDLRGSGESEGLLLDEYSPQELEDGLAMIAWLAEQPWCSGVVGMMGKSWGGFNALQIAALQPPALGAIISVCSTDDRYADDAHYMGGCLLNENLTWGSVLFTLNALPPDPELVGDGWRSAWLERLEHTPLFAETWLQHPRRDAYWKHGSVCEDFARIRCPVYAVGGWADGYSNAVPRLLAGLSVPRKGLVGPWAHVYPHEGVPGPAIGFLQEALRWWDHWLKGRDTGIMDEPMYRAWLQDGARPRTFHGTRPGRWVAEDEWPSPRTQPRRYFLNWRRLEERPAPTHPVEHRSPLTTGLAAGSWCGFGVEGELPPDQREDDGKSLCFDSLPLPETIEILGAPVVSLTLSADRPLAMLAVRLCDVAPDGSATRVSYGLLNLAHRDGHEWPRPLEPGQRQQVRVVLNDAGHGFAPGHRIRVAISNAYWPVAWPSPEPVTLTVFAGECSLELPVRPPRDSDAQLRAFPDPEAAPPPDHVDLDEAEAERSLSRDLASGETLYRVSSDVTREGAPVMYRLEAIDLEMGHAMEQELRIGETDPASARAEISHRVAIRRGDWATRVETRSQLSSNATHFHLTASLDAFEGETRVFTRSWDQKVPRDCV